MYLSPTPTRPDPGMPEATVAARPSWYRRRWVHRTAVAVVVVALAGATVGLVQRNGNLHDTVDAQAAQVRHLSAQVAGANDRADRAESNVNAANQEIASRKQQATKVGGEVDTCVTQLMAFLQAISDDLSAFPASPTHINGLPFTPAQAGANCRTARADAVVVMP